MKYLITGIEGFVGGYLFDELYDGKNEIFGTYFDELLLSEQIKENVVLEKLDIRNAEHFASLIDNIQPDVIFHLAAQSSAAVSWKAPQLTMDININGTINLLEAVRKHTQNTKIVMIGSSEEYGIVPKEDNPINEEYRVSPGNPYSISKVTCEDMCKLYVDAYHMDIVMTRSFNHTGIKQMTKFVIADFTNIIAKISLGFIEPEIKVGNLSAERDFTDVVDVVKAYILVAEKGETKQVYNVGSGISRSIEHYLDYMIKRENLDVKIIPDENRMRPSDNPVICCDNTKLKALGWEQTKDIYKSIDDMIDYNKKILVDT